MRLEWFSSLEEAGKILGYEPKTDTKVGLKRTCEWIIDNKERIERNVMF